jgi:hypothetical protein
LALRLTILADDGGRRLVVRCAVVAAAAAAVVVAAVVTAVAEPHCLPTVGCRRRGSWLPRQASSATTTGNKHLVLPKSLGGGKFCGTYVLRSLQLGQYVSSEKRESSVSGFLNPSCR